MPNYAIVDGDEIKNVIVADSQEIAETLTGKTAIESIDGSPWIGWNLVSGEWRSPQPFSSWSWADGKWNPPFPKPSPTEDGRVYWWNEESQDWAVDPRPLNSSSPE